MPTHIADQLKCYDKFIDQFLINLPTNRVIDPYRISLLLTRVSDQWLYNLLKKTPAEEACRMQPQLLYGKKTANAHFAFVN